MTDVVRVVVVDDSAYVRKVVGQMLSRSPFIEVVGAAREGAEALELVEELKPDVVTCDLNMPSMGGVDFVRAQMARRPVPIVIISIAHESAEQVLAALDAGAVDFAQKPTALATDRLLDMGDDLIQKVKTAARARMRPRILAPEHAAEAPLAVKRVGRGRADVVVIGTSTGGPQALKSVIPLLPGDYPLPIAMVLHMPLGYTLMYAEKLNELSALNVVEAQGDEPVVAGTVFLAQAGRHLTFVRDAGGTVRTRLSIHPLDTPHRPAVDVLFRSAADVFGGRVLGVVLTGMGSDGREGSAWIKAKGGHILTEAEESCVVFGMPRSVVEAGLSDANIPLDRVARAIMEAM